MLLGIFATLMWGMYPLLYSGLFSIGVWQLLSWRIIITMLLLITIIFITNRFRLLINAWQEKWLTYMFVSVILMTWWSSSIYGVLSNRLLDVALGYFMSPIISIVLSWIILKEKITKIQDVAILFTLLGIGLAVIRALDLEEFPWLGLLIGFCVSCYTIVKKRLSGDQWVIQTLELVSLFPIAIGIIWWQFWYKDFVYVFFQNYYTDGLLMLIGIFSVVSLWCFTKATKQLSMLATGFLQFVSPSCNFVFGIVLYHEHLYAYRLIEFILVWIGVAIFIINMVGYPNKNDPH